MKGLDARLGALERVYGVDDGPLVVIFFITRHDPPVSEEECERAKREAIGRNPGQPWYAIYVPPLEAQR